MPNDTTFESFETELNRLVESFGKRPAELKQPGYAEAQLRDELLNPLFRGLGWDMETQGSRSAPTLGWTTLPRWGKPNGA